MGGGGELQVTKGITCDVNWVEKNYHMTAGKLCFYAHDPEKKYKIGRSDPFESRQASTQAFPCTLLRILVRSLCLLTFVVTDHCIAFASVLIQRNQYAMFELQCTSGLCFRTSPRAKHFL